MLGIIYFTSIFLLRDKFSTIYYKHVENYAPLGSTIIASPSKIGGI